MSSPAIALALIDALDDDALDVLAVRLAPRLVARLPTPNYDDGWIDSREAARYVGLPLSSLWKLTAAREIPFQQEAPGCKCWFRRSELDQWREGAWKR